MEQNVPPSLDRPLPFLVRNDLQFSPAVANRQANFVLKDPVSLRYFQLTTAQFELLQSLDGTATLRRLLERLARIEAVVSPNLATIRGWLQDFLHWNLVLVDRPGARCASVDMVRRERWRHILATLRSPLYLQFPGIAPQAILDPLERWFGWWFSRPMIALAVAWTVLVWGFGLVHFEEFQQRLAASAGAAGTWTFWCQLWLAMGVTKILHELGHGLAARRFGAECHSIGLALVFFSPCLFCDVSDAWRLPRRGPRIAIALAGVYVELAVGATAFALWWSTAPGGLHDWCGIVAAVSSVASLLVNLNPLARYDGYYILSDLVGVPNLRQQAGDTVDAWLRCAMHGPDDPVAAGRLPIGLSFALAAYWVASCLYRCSMLIAIAVGLEYWLGPIGLSGVVWVYLGVALFMMLNQGWRRSCRILAPPPGGRTARMWWCLGIGSLVTGAYFAATVPLPRCEAVAFVVEAADARHVYATTSGTLIEVLVAPQEFVKAGQRLARFRSVEHEERRLELLTQCAREEQNLAMFQALNQMGAVEQARETLHKLADQMREVERHLERLTVVAPCDGVVISPPELSRATDGAAEDVLPMWSGTPLAARQLGCTVQAGAWLLSIAPTEARRGVLYVEQRLRCEIDVGQQVAMQADAWPRQQLSATVVDVPRQTVCEIPPVLAAANAGPLDCKTSADGKAVVQSGLFRVAVEMPPEYQALPLGITGWAWVDCRPLTLCERATDYLQWSFPEIGALIAEGTARHSDQDQMP